MQTDLQQKSVQAKPKGKQEQNQRVMLQFDAWNNYHALNVVKLVFL